MKLTTADGALLSWRIDDFTDPWVEPETVLMLHGLAESSEAWRFWVPHLSRRFRVVRLDLRGYGESSPMPEDHPWHFDQLVNDVDLVLDQLGSERVHLVGGKIGGTVALAFAARRPQRVMRLAAVGAPATLKGMAARTPEWRRQIAEEGVEAWVRATQPGRMGSGMAPGQLEWWTQLMARTAASTLLGFLQMVPTVDVTGELDRLQAPTLVVTMTGSGLASVDEVRSWQQRIPRSRLLVIEGTSYHVAASDPDAAAAAVRDFLTEGIG
jgi:3-oxoadipate enol-lactonase